MIFYKEANLTTMNIHDQIEQIAFLSNGSFLWEGAMLEATFPKDDKSPNSSHGLRFVIDPAAKDSTDKHLKVVGWAAKISNDNKRKTAIPILKGPRYPEGQDSNWKILDIEGYKCFYAYICTHVPPPEPVRVFEGSIKFKRMREQAAPEATHIEQQNDDLQGPDDPGAIPPPPPAEEDNGINSDGGFFDD